MNKTLEIKNLTKHYGKVKAVEKLNLTVNPGNVYGILGPNGSGKTTTLGMILDVIAPTSGQYAWFNGKNTVISRQNIGAILETPCFYSYMNAVQNLMVAAHIKECGYEKIEDTLKRVNLYDRRNDAFKTFSLGMKQRLSEVRKLIKDIANEGKTIIIASHLLDEVQKVCTHFCVLRHGVKLHDGSVSDILGETNYVFISGDNELIVKSTVESFEGFQSLEKERDGFMVQLKNGFNSAELNAFCHNHGLTLNKIDPKTKSLEEEFLKILSEK